MAFNPFVGWSQTKLESALADAQQEFAEGKSLASVSAGDGSASKAIQMTPTTRIRKILLALHRLDPVTYPIADIVPTTTTHVSFPHARS